MSSINGQQQVGHGVGGGLASIDNEAFANGTWAGWVEDGLAFFAHNTDVAADRWVCAVYEPFSGRLEPAISDPNAPFYGLSMNHGFAGGGVWAAWLNGFGLFTSYGLHLKSAGLLGVGPRGEVGYKPDYHANGPSKVRERHGEEWTLTAGHAADLQLLGDRRAIWQEGQQLRVAGLPPPQQIGGAWRPRAHLIGGRWWASYWSDAAGIVLHPFDDLTGVIVVPLGTDAWHSAREFGSTVLFALFASEAEQAGYLRREYIDTATVPLVPLVPAPEPPDPEPPDPEPPDPLPPDPEPPDPEPPDPVPPDPVPPPQGGLMLAGYGTPMPGFAPGTERDNGDGTISVQKPNGKWLCVTPDGGVEERDSPGGIWESFKKGRGCLIAERDGEARGPLVYVLPAAETVEP